MAFVPALEMVVWMPRRGETTAVVKGIDFDAAEMWLKPFLGGTKYPATISDRWAEVVAPLVVEVWFVANPPGRDAWLGPFSTRAAAMAAKTDDTIALLHVNPDGTSDFEVFF